MPAVPLTTSVLRTVKLEPNERKRRLFDAVERGLIAEVRPTVITFFVRYPDPRGKTRECRLGHFGSITIDQARREAKRVRAESILGRDPNAERTAARAAMDVRTYAHEQYLPYCKERQRSYQNTVCYVRRIVTSLGSKAMDDLTWADVRDFREWLKGKGLSGATINRHLACLRAMLTRGKRQGFLKGENPASAPGMAREMPREVYLTLDQDKRLIAALGNDQSPSAATALGMLMVTGARKSEILNAEWANVDFDRRELLVPLSKSGHARRIVLPPVAIRLLRIQRHRCDPTERWVFPGSVEGQPIQDLRRIWARVKKEARLPEGVRIHDLRHSMASRLANAGTPLNEIGAILGHRVLATTSRYVHFQNQRLVDTAAIASAAWPELPSPN